jgi:hypothetical protein
VLPFDLLAVHRKKLVEWQATSANKQSHDLPRTMVQDRHEWQPDRGIANASSWNKRTTGRNGAVGFCAGFPTA